MVMLVIGALVIGYLLYFFASSFRHWSNKTAVDRTGDDEAKFDLAISLDRKAADRKAKELEERIAVLERLIEPPTNNADD
jgi:hypothetical protein